MNKKALLIRNILEMIIAVIAIGIVVFAGGTLFATYFGNQQEMQAKATLEKLVFALNEIDKVGEATSFLLTAPQGWYVVAFDANRNFNDKFSKPSTMLGKNCICICLKQCEICKEIKMPLRENDKQALIEIGLKDIWLVNAKDFYNVSKERPTLLIELSESERKEIEMMVLESKSKLEEYESFIEEAVENNYEEVKEYVINKEAFKKIIKAMIVMESKARWNVIGNSGEVGLMQLMPETALQLGLRIYDPEEKFKKDEVDEEYKRIYAEKLREIVREKSKTDLIALDERFDAKKNIEAGTRHLVNLIKQLKDYELGIAAYNSGTKTVKEKCRENILSCESFAGLDYVKRVKAISELV